MKRAYPRRKAILSALTLTLLLPGLAVADSLVIDGGTVHPVTGDAFVGRVVIRDGVIVAAGADAAEAPVPGGTPTIDASVPDLK